MKILKICEHCGKEFEVPHWRDKARFCCRKCCDEHKVSENNLICAICGKPFHRKPYHIKRVKGDFGLCCSRECLRELKKEMMRGENNHQYGLKGNKNSTFIDGEISHRNHKLIEIMVYVGDWYVKANNSGRITKHRFLVEKNYELFGLEYFDKIGDWHYLKDGLEVHHIDFNHNNNNLGNLQILTKGEHRRIHNIANPRKRNSKGQFIKEEV